ncbi:phage tail tape measure protein [Proteus mirabilis]|jgi:lambda family phage tail tape measure protein|uniref:phage tail tape measure protein n=3 Tax=Proteus mirabilis TaxID=584 RepID=UPI000BA0BF78|nr:phage tail tape measure protein [Proteus mirabilis]MBG2791304.1 phage tail tape measure protein [Proteus mirabilis]MBG2823347.1 phage tail tape measure protein [Proteus mirabilis]MBG3108133.1 phage tail tape measure protein [Proteus mirabilis]MBI6371756.1 phage tail tape measure protein [Proteus mirabilis]MCB6148188.1 phage tail tape measure protein [Proteus mirabilis]
MADIATISLKADTSDLERGTQKLKEFGDTAEKVSGSSRNLNDQFNRGVDHQKRAADAIKRQKKELDDLLNSINPTNKAFDALDKATQKLIEANKKGILPKDQFADYNAILEQTRDKLTRVNMSLTAEGRALLAQEAATNRAKQAADDFLNSLKNQTEIIGKTRTEILELKAAQLGVSQQAAPMINKLKEQEKAFLNGSITIGQYRNAMRQLPAQMTDIVTSLASGMPVWMVMIQQGGQIKDSFGGVGNSLKALASLITPARVAMFGFAGAAAAVALAAYKGSQEFGEYNKQLILTGGYAGRTAAQLDALARSLSGNGITQYGMADTISKVVGSGAFSGRDVDMVSKTAAAMEKAVGQSVDETIKQFQRLQEDPVKAVTELDKSLHFLTATQLEQITTLQTQGKEQEAAKMAMESYANAMDERTKQIKENLGTLEKAWQWVGNEAEKAWDKMLNIGREKTLEQQIQEYEEALIEAQIKPAGKDILRYKTGLTVDEVKSKLALLKEKQTQIAIKNASEKAARDEEERKKAQFRADQELKRQYETAEEKHQRTLNEIKNNAYASQAAKDEAIRREKERYEKEKAKGKGKTPTYRPDYGTRVDESANQALLSLQAQLKVLKEHKTVSDVISSERKKLWDMEAKISILEEAQKTRQLTKDEKALLAKKDYILASQEALAIAGDEVKLQELHNRELDKQLKRVEEINARSRALELGAGKSDRMYQRDIALEKAKSPDERKALEEYYAKEDSIRDNWELGVKKGFAEFQEQATNVYGNVAQISQSAFQGMSNSLSDFVLTGKANFADFTRSFLEMTTKMLMQMAMLNAMKAAFGGNAVGNFFGFASGGYTGGGGKYDPAGVVHKGEFVFTKEATQRLGVDNLYRLMDAGKRGYASGGHVGGSAPMSVTQPTAFIARNPQIAGGGVNVTIDMSGVKIETEQQQSAMPNIDVRAAEQSLKNKVKSLFISEGREGGDLYKIIKAVSGNR